MKGLISKGDGGIHLHIKHGGIVQESKHEQPNFDPIEVTNPRTGKSSIKYVKRYRGVEALIKKIEWYDKEYDGTTYRGWKLILDADGTACTLDIPFESRVGSRFAKLAENINFTEPVEFSAWRGDDDKTAFTVKQNGENIPQKYTKDNPGECPVPTQKIVAGKPKWDFDDQWAYLHQVMEAVVIPRVDAANGLQKPATEDSNEYPPTNDTDVSGLLTGIQSQLKDYAKEQKTSVKDAMEVWFSTREWEQVQQMDAETLKAVSRKLDDSLIPF